MKNEPFILAVSGVKNSGKTTLLTRLLPILKEKGLKVAVIKHDGHEFEADVPGTDSYRHMQAGAYGTAVFSESKYMVVKQQTLISVEKLIEMFPEADIIFLEGFKHSEFPKLEVIRKENRLNMQNGVNICESVCTGYHLLGIVTDLKKEEIRGVKEEIPFFDINAIDAVADFIRSRMALQVE